MTDINIGAITELMTEKVDTDAHNLDSTGKKYVGSMAIPSDTYIDIPSTSGSNYTAPADGYVCFKNNNTGTGNVQGYIENTTKSIICTISSTYNNGGGFVPVAKGDNVYLYYNIGVSATYYRFIYAKGSV